MIDFSKVDFRTEKQKAFDEICEAQGKEYLKLLDMGASKTRAILYMCQHYGITEPTMRSRLVRAGVYEFSKKKAK